MNEWLTLTAGYTYMDARKDDGTRLWRIPRNAASFGVNALLFDAVKASVTAKVALDTVDVYMGTGKNVPLEDYVLLNAKVSYDLKPGVTAYVRGENLLDQKYETVLGYGTPRLSVYTGLAFKFGE
jgi:vitamin B12 transporter